MVDVIVTISAGGQTAERNANAISSGGGLVGIASHIEPPAGVAIDFLDWPFMQEESITVEDHLAAARRHRPKYAVAPDVMGDRPLDEVIRVGERLAQHAQFVIVVPKTVPVADVPDHFIAGIPFREEWDTDTGVNEFADFRGRPVHILGGNPTEQMKLAVRFDYRVTSVDSPNPLSWADGGRVWVARLGGADSVRRLLVDELTSPPRSFDREQAEQRVRSLLLDVEGVPRDARDDTLVQLLDREAINDLSAGEFIRTINAGFLQEEAATVETVTGAPSYRRLLESRYARLQFTVSNLVQAWERGRRVTRQREVAPGRGPPPPMDEPVETFPGETLTVEEQMDRFLEATVEEELGRVRTERGLSVFEESIREEAREAAEQTGERVTLVQCTASKREGCHPARDLYDESRYFRRMRAWAEARGNPWFILSAKHGLVEPDEVVCDYDERGLDEGLAEAVADELVGRGVSVVDITAGRDYTESLIPALERHGVEVVEHFAGEPIGRREQLLQEATERLRENT